MNPKQQHGEQKKQIRRRCKARRPCKEMHLNTAEARKEIATALKFHRERQQKQDQQMKQASPLHPCFEYEGRMKSRINPRIYPYDCSYYLDHSSNFSDVSSYPIAPSLAEKQNLNVELPVQTLGLNLNFHHFISMDNSAVLYNESFPFHQEVPRSITFAQEGELMASGVLDSKLPTGEGEKDSEGTSREQHQEAMERQEELDKKAVEIDDQHNFGEVMEFPDWLSLNDNCLQQHLNYHCSEDNFQDPDLSWMDLGKIEDVVEEDWFA